MFHGHLLFAYKDYTIHRNNLSRDISLEAIYYDLMPRLKLTQPPSDYIFYQNGLELPISSIPLYKLPLNQNDPILLVEKDKYNVFKDSQTSYFPSLVVQTRSLSYNAKDLIIKIEKIHQSLIEASNKLTKNDFNHLNLSVDEHLNEYEKAKQIFDCFISYFCKINKISIDEKNDEDEKCTYLNENNLYCDECGEKMFFNRNDYSLITKEQYENGVRNTSVYSCGICGKQLIVPHYYCNIQKILEEKTSKSDNIGIGRGSLPLDPYEKVLLLWRLLTLHDLSVRVVLKYPSFFWLECWIESEKRYIHIDPTSRIFDYPLYYEHNKEKMNSSPIGVVVAIGLKECQNVSNKYISTSSILKHRQKLLNIDDIWIYNFALFKTKMWQEKFHSSPKETQIISERLQNDKALSSTLIDLRDTDDTDVTENEHSI
ncbi:hypothetical protein TRFO_12031 [Tritrichomonas foetus]|uniref:Uncharacterized protein n=1 Tax=Tritrichomonas foetus TaxID=1144522 RepID=A0A1J4J377_9EUKA|nr:hypothetical protein TRFO_12031 [Tritrichomonas foetus]|eukprot:OHS93201.1 hypothetical protein TRFO_12031 [Tritrichomonas foetus]